MRRALLLAALAAAASGCSLLSGDFTLSGTVDLSPRLRERAPKENVMLFVIAENAGGVPVAVHRIVNPEFPAEFTMVTADLLVPSVRRMERLKVHAARMLAHENHHTIPKDSDAPLFLSRQPPRHKPGEPVLPLPPLDERVLYRTVRGCLEAAYKSPQGLAVIAPQQRLAFGAAIIRNTLIAHWLATEAETSTVLTRAGLEGTRSLRVGALAAE